MHLMGAKTFEIAEKLLGAKILSVLGKRISQACKNEVHHHCLSYILL
jgi:hypothetical protein